MKHGSLKFGGLALVVAAAVGSWGQPLGAETSGNREQVEGRELAAEMCALQPTAGVTNEAVLVLRDAEGNRTRIPLTIVTLPVGETGTGWTTTYTTHPQTPAAKESLAIRHWPDRSPTYVRESSGGGGTGVMPAGQASVPFAGSDFWLDDLGLEFLHWPEQRIVPGPRGDPPMVKGRSCKVLESRNPAGGPYSRVVSWVDNEFKSLIQADAYDPNGRLLKRFSIGSFKKVEGVWQLKDMEMIDERRDTKSRLEFELNVAK